MIYVVMILIGSLGIKLVIGTIPMIVKREMAYLKIFFVGIILCVITYFLYKNFVNPVIVRNFIRSMRISLTYFVKNFKNFVR